MIKAEIIYQTPMIGDHIIGAIHLDAKGKHHELVAELGATINMFNNKEDYHDELMNIIEQVLKKNLEDASKELEKLKREKENK